MLHKVNCYDYKEILAVIENLKDMGIYDYIEDDSNPEYVVIMWTD